VSKLPSDIQFRRQREVGLCPFRVTASPPHRVSQASSFLRGVRKLISLITQGREGSDHAIFAPIALDRLIRLADEAPLPC
jgi:hypothetical protein